MIDVIYLKNILIDFKYSDEYRWISNLFGQIPLSRKHNYTSSLKRTPIEVREFVIKQQSFLRKEPFNQGFFEILNLLYKLKPSITKKKRLWWTHPLLQYIKGITLKMVNYLIFNP